MDETGNPLTNALIEALRALYAPIIQQSARWPPALAYGVPAIIAGLLIVLFRSALPTTLFYLMSIVILAPLAAYILVDWNRRGTGNRHQAITGNVLFEDGIPVENAVVAVDGIDRRKKTDENGWFQIAVDGGDTWTVRATYMGQAVEQTVNQDEVTRPVTVSLKRTSHTSDVAAVCYRFADGALEFLLVKTRQGRWTFPKGNAEGDRARWSAAAREALEEAGASGDIEHEPLVTYRYQKKSWEKRGLEVEVQAFLLHVKATLKPDKKYRKPKWFSAAEAEIRLAKGRPVKYAEEARRVLQAAASRLGG